MKTKSAEQVLIFYICLYWIFFVCTLVRVLVTLYDVCYRKTTRWTHAKTIHATIAAALLARAVHLTLLHVIDDWKNLFISAPDEDMLFKILGSVPAHILVTIHSLLGLLWISILVKTYDTAMLVPKTFTLLGKTYDSTTTGIMKHHLNIFCLVFNIFLYLSWIIFLILMFQIRKLEDTIYGIENIFTSAVAVVLSLLFVIYYHRISGNYTQNNILSVERHRISKRILWLVVLCSAVFAIKLPIILYISLSHHTTWLTSFTFDVITFTLLEIIPFFIILVCTGGKKVEELRHESVQFSFSFRKYTM